MDDTSPDVLCPVDFLVVEFPADKACAALEPDSYAAIRVYENGWAAPFGAAVRRAGGQLVANGRIPTQALLAAVAADDETSEEGA